MILRGYQQAVILLLGVGYFINLPGYTSVVDSALPKVFTVQLFAALVLPVVFRAVSDRRLLNALLKNPLIYWCVAYLLIACIWFPFSGHSVVEQQVFKYRVLMVIHIVGFVVLFSEAWSLQFARKTIVGASLIAVALNYIDFADPGLLVPLDQEFANPGRAAGFYINANRAGMALVIGFLLGAGIIPRRWRSTYMALVFSGIAITFSRSAILALVVGLLFCWRAGVVSLKQVLAAAAIVVIAGLGAIGTVLSDESWKEVTNIDNIVERAWFLTNPLATRDFSSGDRLLAARVGLQYFGEQPILGHGIGSTYAWRHHVSTHNMYLYFMVEHGIIGLFIFPALVWACVRSSRAPARPWLMAYAAALLVVGFFTHNAAEEPFFIISYALAASMNLLSQQTVSRRSSVSLPLPLASVRR